MLLGHTGEKEQRIMFSFMHVGPSTAYLFPGQGGQHVGMVKELCERYPRARRAMQEADDVLGFSVSTLCFQGPEEALTDTINAQPAILAASIAVLHAIQAEFEQQSATAPDLSTGQAADSALRYAAGHSFGEYTALVATGSIQYADGLHLVRERGRLMKEAGELRPGMMAAILGMDSTDVAEICQRIAAETGANGSTKQAGALQIANDNCPGQVVISGDHDSVERAIDALNAAGARKIVRLAVSIAAHSALMQPAAAELSAAIEATPIVAPNMPIIGNTTARPLATPEEIRSELTAQLTSGVRWSESMQMAVDAGIDNFVEIGPGDALTGMIKRVNRKAKRRALNEPEPVATFVQELVATYA